MMRCVPELSADSGHGSSISRFLVTVPVSEDTQLVSVFADLDNGKPVDCGSTEPEPSAPKTGVTGIVFAIAAAGIAMTAHFKKKICA